MTAIVLLGLVSGATAASAHNSLASTDPADGATVAVAPAAVTLTFNEPAQALGSQIRVSGPDGAVVSTGDVVLSGSTVAEHLVDARPAGTYTVAWRVTSTDGHPVSGSFTFTATGAAGASAATASATASATADLATADPTTSVAGSTASASPLPSGTLVIAPSPTPSSSSGASTEISPGLVAALVILLAGAGAAAVLVARRRGR